MKFFFLILMFLFLNFSPALAQVTTTPSSGQCSSSSSTACSNFNQSSPSPTPSTGSSPSSSPSSSPTPETPTPEPHAGFWAIVSAAIANPGGAVNAFINMIVDFIGSVFPSTPDNLKIGNLINSVGDSMPAVGRGIVREFFVIFSSCFGLALVIKIYKLIPFKAS